MMITSLSCSVTPTNTLTSSKTHQPEKAPNSSISASTQETSISISVEASALQLIPPENVRDPKSLKILEQEVDATNLPVQTLTPDQVFIITDEASFKGRIKEDFNSVGVYVDDKFVDACYKCYTTPFGISGRVPPDMDLPDPPSWWVGYRPMKA